MAFTLKQRSILPGFGLSLGFTIFYFSLIVLIPLSATFLKASSLTWAQFWHVVSSPRAVASYRLEFWRVVHRGVDQFVFRPVRGMGAGALQVSRQAVCWTRWWICHSRCPRR